LATVKWLKNDFVRQRKVTCCRAIEPFWEAINCCRLSIGEKRLLQQKDIIPSIPEIKMQNEARRFFNVQDSSGGEEEF
jgi:hypothetical protein